MSSTEARFDPTVIIRDRDYYGGTVTFTMPEASWDTDEGALAIRWDAWGQHGTARIVLKDEAECRRLAAALLHAADVLDGVHD